MADNIPLLTISSGDPNWASDINTNFSRIAGHNHSLQSGSGIIVDLTNVSCVTTIDPYLTTDSGMSINGLYFLGFNNLSASPELNSALYVRNDELYYTNFTSIPIQLTQNGAVNVKIIGGAGFTGNLAAYGASVRYTSATDLYQFFGSSGSLCSLFVNNANFQTVTAGSIVNLDSVNLLGNLNVSNVSSAASGSYLCYEGATYSSSLTPVAVSSFASTGTIAQSSLAQTNFTQAYIEKSYATNILCYFMSFYYANGLDFNIQTPNAFVSGLNAYQISGSNIASKGNNLIFSIYNRDGTNFPIVYNTNNNYFYFNDTYDQSLFTPLAMPG